MHFAKFWLALALVTFLLLLAACGEQRVDVDELKSKPKAIVGSVECRQCHLEHFDSWMTTLHSRMLQDVRKNRDAIIAELDPQKIRADLAKIPNLKVPADQIYIPKPDEILYTIGSQWKQRYIIERNNMLVVAPVQYNSDTGRWVNYNEAVWETRSWILQCGGCHATGVNLEKGNFVEPGVGCEACHGGGSWHIALPREQVYEKRQTIVNPAKLTPSLAVQICGSCHNRGKATKHDKAEWAVGYEPGKALETYFKSTSFAGGDAQHLYGNEFSKAHHQQYIDWKLSRHYLEGVNCTSCHEVHPLGMLPTRFQTTQAGSQVCLSCHTQLNSNKAHAIHSFGNCIGCHMPRIVKSAESGDLHSHTFSTLLPRVTLENKDLPNSCVNCHQHKDADLQLLQQQYDLLTRMPRPQGQMIPPIPTASAKAQPKEQKLQLMQQPKGDVQQGHPTVQQQRQPGQQPTQGQAQGQQDQMQQSQPGQMQPGQAQPVPPSAGTQ